MLLLVSSIFLSTNCHATSQDAIRSYISNNFSKIILTQEQIAQLSWIMDHKRRSHDMDLRVANPKIHIEISRALTRLYCMQLLKDGSKTSYDQFVAAQLSNDSETILTFVSFKKLSKYLQNLSDDDYAILQDAIILSAVSLSEQAARLASNFLVQQEINDNLDFLAKTVRLEANIFPLTQKYRSDRAATKKIFYILFPPQTNFRHMLYTEGGIGMFTYLRSMIQHNYINQDDLDLWYAYWIVNIAGFRGHVTHTGSVYLTETVFQAMTKLKHEIDQMLYIPNHNPLIAYLNYRADLIGLQHASQEQKLLFGHISALLRMYDVSDGKILQKTFNKLSRQQHLQINKFFMQGLQDPLRGTTTYMPAVFANTLQLCNGDKQKTLNLILPVYSRAVAIYNEKIQSGTLEPGLAINFNQFSASHNLRRILALGLRSVRYVDINVSGEVILL